MNKYFYLSFIFLFLSINLVNGFDIGYVVKYPSNLDINEQTIKNFLNNEGHTTTILDDVTFDESLYDLIIVSESVNDINNIFDHTNTKTLFMSNNAAKKKGLGASYGVTSGRHIRIDKSEGITEGYSLESRQVYTSQSYMEYLSGCFPINSDILVSKFDITKPIILALDIDSLLIDSSCTDRDKEIFEKNLYFGLYEANNWNSNAEDLFRNSIEWLEDSPNYQAPVIESFSPTANAELIENTNNTFSITYSDADNLEEVTVNWKVDGQSSGSGDTYIFNKAIGTYEVIAVVSDNRFTVEQNWQVTVIDSSTLTCSVQGGDICTSEEICNGNILESSNSNNCCSVTCSLDEPNFDKADTCSSKNNDIDIEFTNIDNNEDFNMGDKISPTLKISNDLNQDKDFKIKTYFYDITDNKIIEKDSKTLSINKNKNKIIGFEFDIGVNLDADNNYALLTVINDDQCNQEFKKIDLVRKDNEVIINKIEIKQNELICGDPLNLKVYVQNIGNNDQDVYIKLKNSKLKIDEQTEGFKLEKFDKDDSEKREFNLNIPDNIKSGPYTLRTEISYGNQKEYADKTITLGNCGNEDSLGTIKNINLGVINKDIKEEDLGTKGGSSFFRNLFLVFLIIFAGIGSFVVYSFSHN